MSLFERLGGQAALESAVFIFYEKMLADSRVNHYFKGLNMKTLQEKMVDTLEIAFGDTEGAQMIDLRQAHKHLSLSEDDFAITAEHLKATLDELNVPDELQSEAMHIVASTKAAVLNQ